MRVYNVLIAEDEKPLRDKLMMNIDWESQGYQVYQAKDGEEALSVLKHERIDILVTDIQMPRVNGIELVRKAKELLPNLWVIIISGHPYFEYTQALAKSDVGDYLLKPFRSQRLLDMVNNTRATLLESG